VTALAVLLALLLALDVVAALTLATLWRRP
jgi:hypothetical protein